jgi:hypothetical protein
LQLNGKSAVKKLQLGLNHMVELFMLVGFGLLLCMIIFFIELILDNLRLLDTAAGRNLVSLVYYDGDGQY